MKLKPLKPIRTKTPAQALRAALRRLGPNGERWIKERQGIDENGVPTVPGLQPTCKFCAAGAIYSVTDYGPTMIHDRAFDFLLEARPTGSKKRGDGITDFNDATRRTFPQIKSWFERAIALAEKASP